MKTKVENELAAINQQLNILCTEDSLKQAQARLQGWLEGYNARDKELKDTETEVPKTE